jgi:hypothetical protein
MQAILEAAGGGGRITSLPRYVRKVYYCVMSSNVLRENF